MNKALMAILVCFLSGCAINMPVKHEYNLEAFSSTSKSHHGPRFAIAVSQPEAISGFQTEQMLYVKKPFELSSFAHNAWVGPPANLLFPLIVQSLQQSGYFYAVASSLYAEKADYRLDTQLIKLNQNFLTKPSVIELVVKVVLTDLKNHRVVASQIIGKQITCLQESPYGGVIAANKASKEFTRSLSNFVINAIMRKNSQAKR